MNISACSLPFFDMGNLNWKLVTHRLLYNCRPSFRFLPVMFHRDYCLDKWQGYQRDKAHLQHEDQDITALDLFFRFVVNKHPFYIARYGSDHFFHLVYWWNRDSNHPSIFRYYGENLVELGMMIRLFLHGFFTARPFCHPVKCMHA